MAKANLNTELCLETLQLGYVGGTFDNHRMEARQLADVIQNVHKLLEIISEDIYDKSLDFNLYVEPPEIGSFLENFKIECKLTGREVNKFFNDHPKIAFSLCFSLVAGVVLNGTGTVLHEMWTPEHLKEYHSIGNDIADRIIKTSQRKLTQDTVHKLAKPFAHKLTDESQLVIKGDDSETITIESPKLKEVLDITPQVEEKDQLWKEELDGTTLSIVQPDLKGGNKWGVAFNDAEGEMHTTSIVIEDALFLAYMARENVSISREHTLYADIQFQITKKAGAKRSSGKKWFITKIYTMKNRISGETIYNRAKK